MRVYVTLNIERSFESAQPSGLFLLWCRPFNAVKRRIRLCSLGHAHHCTLSRFDFLLCACAYVCVRLRFVSLGLLITKRELK